MRKASAMSAKRRNETTKGGFHLDDVEQWDNVLSIPDEIGDKIVSYLSKFFTTKLKRKVNHERKTYYHY